MKIGKLKTHPAADRYPLLEGAEYEALVASIKSSGLKKRGTRLGDKILDGRNRAKACADAGVEMQWEEFDGGDIEAFVRAANLHRRHLSLPARAMLAARAVTVADDGSKADAGVPAGTVTPAKAAELYGIGLRTVRRALNVLRHAVPELVACVDRGHCTVECAEALSRIPPEVQRGVAERAWGEDDEEPMDLGEVREIIRKHTPPKPAPEPASSAGTADDSAGAAPAAPQAAQGAPGRVHVGAVAPVQREGQGDAPAPPANEPGEAAAPRVRTAAIPDPAGAPEHALNEWDWFGRRLYALAPDTFAETVEALRAVLAKLEDAQPDGAA